MSLPSDYQAAMEAELDHYIRLSNAQGQQLKRYAELLQRSHQLLTQVIGMKDADFNLD